MDSTHYIGFPKQQQTLLHKIRDSLVRRDFPKSLQLIEEAKKISLDGEDEMLNEALFLYGKTMLTKGYYGNNSDYLNEAFEYFSFLEMGGFSNNTALHIEISKYHTYTENQALGLEHLQIAEKYATKKKDKIRLAVAYGQYHHSNSAPTLCLEYAENATSLLNGINDIYLQIEAHQLFLLGYVDSRQFDKIPTLARKILDWCKEIDDAENEIRAINALGISYAIKNDLKNAFEHFNLLKEKSERIGYNQYLATSLLNLGNVFSALLNFEEAIKSFTSFEKDFKDYVSPAKIGVCYFNLGGIYLQQFNYDEGRFYMRKALEIGKELKFTPLISRPLFRIINAYIEEENYEEALKLSGQVEEATKDMTRIVGEDIHFANLACIYEIQQKYDLALEYGLKCIERCKIAKNHKTLIRIYKLVAKIYKHQGDFEQAYNYMESYVETQIELSKEQRKRQIIDLEIQYETKEKEKQIEILKSEMEVQELKLQHQAEIEEQNLKLRNVNEDLRQFTYAASHDLKEPIRMIGSFTKILYRQYLPDMNEDQKQYFDYVMNGADRMSKMIQGLLLYATVGTKEKDFEWIDLKTTIVEVMKNLYFAIQDNKAVIEVGDLPKVFSNPVLVTQLIQNLISNAIKFRKKDVPPTVTIGWEDKEKYDVIFVKDNGIGIPPEHQDVIFKIFKRLHKKNSYEGTGLGLSMVKKIVNQLRGEIWLTSKVNEGTTFYISLPKKIL